MPHVYVHSKENASNHVIVDGQIVVKLCRCGRSQNMPLCDSSHRTCGFQAPAADTVIVP